MYINVHITINVKPGVRFHQYKLVLQSILRIYNFLKSTGIRSEGLFTKKIRIYGRRFRTYK